MRPETNEPASPCVKVCELDDNTGLCKGCWHTLDEIACWSSFSNTEKHAVLKLIEQRKDNKYYQI